MKILFIVRSTLYSAYGGDTVQIVSTAKYLQKLGVAIDIKLAHEKIDYKGYDLLHLFNIIRPADALVHVKRSGLPYVVSTIFLDHNEFQKTAPGIRGIASKYISADGLEYAKAIARWIKNGETIKSIQYLFYGHKKSVIRLAGNASFLLPNSENEYIRFVNRYQVFLPHKVVYNGIDPENFFFSDTEKKIVRDPAQVLCVARIEGNKNQLNLIKALNNTAFRLKLVGKPATNHLTYYGQCKSVAAGNVSFAGFIPQGEELVKSYLSAKVHVLPSWNETCGLSSLEAAYLGCNIVVTAKGDTVEYYGNNAWYCDPGDPASIYEAIQQAATAPVKGTLQDKIATIYNWQQAATETLAAYKDVLGLSADRKKSSKYKTGIKVSI